MPHNCLSRYAKFHILTITACTCFLISCSNSIAIEKNSSPNSEIENAEILKTDPSSTYKGWDLLAKHLIKDGVSPAKVSEVLNSEDMPPISFIPFKLNPVESKLIYDRMTETARLDRAESFLNKFNKEFIAAENKYGVTRFVIAAIISVETNWGSYTGNEQVLNRLARVASAGEPNNIKLNYRKLNLADPTVTLEQVQARNEYLFKIFYPQVLALFNMYSDNPTEMLKLKGSVAGAFGLPQFLPKSYEDHAVDGNNNQKIDLFEPEDAILSVASFLKFHGWKKLLPSSEKLAVLWHYNRSDAYGRAVIKVALNLQNRTLDLP